MDQNGAGIRQEGDGLTVRRSWFHDNEDGILGGGSAASDVLVEHCEFERNGYGDGLSHNIYIGAIRSFTLRYCYMHHARIGHEVKSRAATNYILYNRISNEDGNASRNIDLPNAGTAYLVGNVIHQGVNTDNATMFGFGAEGGTGTAWVVNNTFVNERSLGTAVYVYDGCAAVLKDNLFHGTTTIVTVSGTGAYSGDHNRVPGGASGAAGLTASVIGGDPSFADEAAFDYSLGENSVCRDAGTAPGSAGGFDLTPAKQYVHPASFEPRPAEGPPDIGAYEYAPPGSDPNGGGSTGRGGCEGGGGGSAASFLVTFAVVVSFSAKSHRGRALARLD